MKANNSNEPKTNTENSRFDRFTRAVSFLWLDDKTGKQSDTTLRTWILFFVFVAYTIYVAFIDSEITNTDIELLQLLSIAFLGMGGLYLGKRTFVKDPIGDDLPYSTNEMPEFPISHSSEKPEDSRQTERSRRRESPTNKKVESDPIEELQKRGISA